MRNRRITALASPALRVCAVLLVAAPAYASEGGLVLTPDLLLLGVLLALFAAMIFPLNALIFRPILRVFDERRQKISGTAARAEKLRKEADEIIARYEHAVQTVREEAEAQRRAQLEVARGEGASELSGARAGADREIETARQSIESSLDAARAALRGEAAILARQAAERVLGRPL